MPNKAIKADDVDVSLILKELSEHLNYSKQNPFEDVLLVCMQHILGTTFDMFSVMHELGLKDAVVGGKNYSTHLESAEKIKKLGYSYIPDVCQLGYGYFDNCMREVIHNIWAAAIEKLKTKKFKMMILLDDGADLLRSLPGIFFSEAGKSFKPDLIIGIEQTRSGANHPQFIGLPFPVINVAGAFSKTEIEYHYVAKLVLKSITQITNNEVRPCLSRDPVVGILGYGTMGKAVVRQCIANNIKTIVYDKNHAKSSSDLPAMFYDNSAILIANADIIIGCTGENIFAYQKNLSAALYSRERKWFVSTGSKDHEFHGLLQLAQREVKTFGYMPDVFQDIEYKNKLGVSLKIIRGGFPINFTNEKHSVAPRQIWPTRASLFFACLMAIEMKNDVGVFMLSHESQFLIIKKYIEINPNDEFVAHLSGLSDKELKECIVSQSCGKKV